MTDRHAQPACSQASASLSDTRQRGAILILALLVMIVLAGLVLVYARSMRVELQAAANRVDAAEAMQIALGAIEAVLAMDENVPIEAVPVGQGGYWILRLDDSDPYSHAFGLTDEAGKLNLNAAPPEMLAMLPGSDDDLASAIVAWRGDGDSMDDGYYMSLSEPYQAKADLFESVEELLLVRGMTPQRLYGSDVNLNGVIDPAEQQAGRLGFLGNEDEHFGIRPFVTAYSRPPVAGVDDETDAGENGGPTPPAGDAVGGGNGGGGGTGGAGGAVNVNRASASRLEEAMQGLVDSPDTVAQAIRDARPHRNIISVFYASTLEVETFSQVEPRLRVAGGGGGGMRVPVNVSTAPRAVLATLPGLDASDADALVAHRQMLRESNQHDLLRSVAWITQVLDTEKAVEAGDYITARGQQRSADIVALSSSGRAFERIRIVYDTADAEPRLLAWHRLTHLGWPLDPAWRDNPVFDGTAGGSSLGLQLGR